MCYTEGQRKQEEMRAAFWPWTQPPWLTSFMLLGALTTPSKEKDYSGWQWSHLGPCSFLIQGGSDDSAPGLRCLKTFGSTAESRRLLVLFASWVFAEMTLQLASPSDIRPASCHWLNYCLLGFISFFFSTKQSILHIWFCKTSIVSQDFAGIFLVTL